MTDSDEKKERESIDEERREWLKKLGIGAGAAVIGSGVLGFQAGRASAYNPSNRTVYGENIQNLQSIGTSTEPVESINTEQGLIEQFVPSRKIGLVSDMHWGHYGTAGLSDSETMLKNKIDEFCTEFNNWGADAVIFLGDNTHGGADKTDAQNTITNMRNYIENQLNATAYYVMGNHEYENCASWGTDWFLSPYGYSTQSDTYFTIDFPEVKIMIIDDAYSTDDASQDHDLQSGEYDWIESELQKSSKPVIPISHVPISKGNCDDYDSLESDADFELPRLFGKYDNIICSVYGHTHHDQNQRPHPTFNKSVAQDYLGTRYFYQHFPHRLGGTLGTGDGDSSYTPFGKMEVFANGYANIIQSYAGEGSGFREQFSALRGNNYRTMNDEFLEARVFKNNVPLSVDNWAKVGTGSMSNGDNGVVGAFLQVSSGSTSGDTYTGYYDKPQTEFSHDYGNTPYDILFRCVAQIGAGSDTNALTEWKFGARKGENHPYIGWEVDNGSLLFVVANENENRTTVDMGMLSAGVKHLYQFVYSHELGRIDVWFDNHLQEEYCVDADNFTTIANMTTMPLISLSVTTNEAASKFLKFWDGYVKVVPSLDVVF